MTNRLRPILALHGLSRPWKIAVYASLGVVLGFAVFVVRISNAASYLSNDPQTCMNCHVMTDAYATWQRGSHGHFALCNDCHVPHSNPVAKTAFKATDGMRHSWVFTTGQEPEVLELSKGAIPVIQSNCVRCHDETMEHVRLPGTEERTCWHCHQNIHGEAHSLSGSPPELRPTLPPAGLGLFEND